MLIWAQCYCGHFIREPPQICWPMQKQAAGHQVMLLEGLTPQRGSKCQITLDVVLPPLSFPIYVCHRGSFLRARSTVLTPLSPSPSGDLLCLGQKCPAFQYLSTAVCRQLNDTFATSRRSQGREKYPAASSATCVVPFTRRLILPVELTGTMAEFAIVWPWNAFN